MLVQGDETKVPLKFGQSTLGALFYACRACAACSIAVKFEDGKEGFLRHLHVADLLHAFLASLLLLEQFALAADVASVTFGSDVLADLLDGLAGDNLASDCGLYGDVELLTGKEFLEAFTHAAAEGDGVVDVGERGEGVDAFAVEEDVEADKFGGAEAGGVIIEGSVATTDALEFVVEVDDDFAQWHEELDFDAVAGDEFLLDEFAALAKTEGHDRADVGGSGDDSSADIGFFDMLDERGVGHARGVVDFLCFAVLVVNHVGYVGDGGDDVHVEFAVETFLHDFHVEESEEAAAETEAEGG